MLSRVAEALYWTARYVERAEDVTRLLDVEFHGQLDAPLVDQEEAWGRLVSLLGDDAAFAEHFDRASAHTVTDWILWHRGNPNAVANCVVLARENARSVREQISGEMWEAINRLFLVVRAANRAAVSRGPHAFFEQLRTGAHLFQGTVDATMTVGDPREFIRLGLHLERADKTTRVVAARYPVAVELAEEDPARARQLVALLRSCGSWEAYLKRHGTRVEPLLIAEELIRSPELPRAVLHCLQECRAATERIRSESGAPRRVLGRLCADLEFGEVTDVSGPAVARTLRELLTGINAAGEALTKAYFSSRPLPVAALVAQEAQQQQCG